MDIRQLILDALRDHGEVRVADITRATGLSRAYIHRFFRDLVDEGRIIHIGKANQSRYVPADRLSKGEVKKRILKIRHVLKNQSLAEDTVLARIKKESGIFLSLSPNVSNVLDYAFTEMVNNAIEHSRSATIDIKMWRSVDKLCFDVSDRGVGIFDNIAQKKGLAGHMEAIQDLLKGKETTAPEAHSGEGIFFTSKVADLLTIRSSVKKLVFDNTNDDIYIRDIRPVVGTKVFFCIGIDSATDLSTVFTKFTGDSYSFDKTSVRVRLFASGVEYVSRSQARRIMAGLEKFQKIELDFKGIDTVGQAFADEIFRVWKGSHPEVTIDPQNAGENVMFMIKRATAGT